MVLPPIIIKDLGLDVPFTSGQVRKVKNCWHFSTDGNAIDIMFSDEADFKAGMNRVYVVLRSYNVVILAFCLMDTHVHFVLYGTFDDCNRFVHDFIKRTSMYIADRHGEHHRLENVPIHHQEVDTEDYLKTVICYVVKNAPAGGIPFQGIDYPWSSGPLSLRKQGWWSSPRWLGEITATGKTIRDNRKLLKTRALDLDTDLQIPMIDDIVFPGEYVAYEIVEKLFRSHKAQGVGRGVPGRGHLPAEHPHPGDETTSQRAMPEAVRPRVRAPAGHCAAAPARQGAALPLQQLSQAGHPPVGAGLRRGQGQVQLKRHAS